MRKEIKHTAMVIGGGMKRHLEDAIKAWIDFKLYGKTKESDVSETFKGAAGSSKYTTYVIGPCITRVYTGQTTRK